MAVDLCFCRVVQTEDIIWEGEFSDGVLTFLTDPTDSLPLHFPTQGETDRIPRVLCPVQTPDESEAHYLTVSLLLH